MVRDPHPPHTGPNQPDSRARENRRKKRGGHGPPEIALRNAKAFILHVMDYADDDDAETAYRELGRDRWTTRHPLGAAGTGVTQPQHPLAHSARSADRGDQENVAKGPAQERRQGARRQEPRRACTNDRGVFTSARSPPPANARRHEPAREGARAAQHAPGPPPEKHPPHRLRRRRVRSRPERRAAPDEAAERVPTCAAGAR